MRVFLHENLHMRCESLLVATHSHSRPLGQQIRGSDGQIGQKIIGLIGKL